MTHRGRFVMRTAPAPLPPHVIFPDRCAVPPVSWPLQRHDRQALIFTVITAVSGAVLLALLAARRFETCRIRLVALAVRPLGPLRRRK